MNSKDFIQVLRKVIREEVQTAVRTELGNIGSMITEQRKSVQKNTMYNTRQAMPSYTPKRTATPVKRQLTTNPMLNDILNETGAFHSEGPMSMMNENIDYSSDFDEWPTMQMNGMAGIGQVANTIPKVDTEGRHVDVSKLPEAVVQNLTKDYSALMKAIDKKKGN
jgi:flagellar biosynthesis/type III secretory pathway chaperone